jgi:radical SAM protein with 4Fe4S-binding SPASM domain
LSAEQRLGFWRTLNRRQRALRGRMDLLADCFSLVIDRPGAPYRCNIGSQLRMDPDGNLYPCQCFHAGAAYRLGNVRQTSIAAVVEGERLRTIIEQCLSRPERIPACSRCRWMNFCGAGCMGNAYEAEGDPLTPDACTVREHWLLERFAERLHQVPARTW